MESTTPKNYIYSIVRHLKCTHSIHKNHQEMKRILITMIMICTTTNLFSQSSQENAPTEKRNSVTVGILQGGGSLIGADIEFMLTDKFGIQLGAGLIGFGGGLNYHLKPSIRSSFISLQYWNQGVGDSFTQSVIGPNFVYRSKKWFTAQIGLGFPLQIGPAAPTYFKQPPAMLMYSVGAYFPI